MYWPKGPAQTVEQPPPEYDRPYNGTIRLSRVGTVQDLVKQCNRPDKIRLGGCAHVVDGECIIFMMPDDYLRALDTNPFDVFRHEIGTAMAGIIQTSNDDEKTTIIRYHGAVPGNRGSARTSRIS